MNGTAAPVDTPEITYNAVVTLADALFAPPAFAEPNDNRKRRGGGKPSNLQPLDTSYTTTIGGIPAWTVVGGYLQGTAPEVAGDNVTNPSDTTTVTVYRTNVYGTSQGTLTIVINNLTAPVITPVTGFTHEATSTALVDADTLGDGSVVAIDETLGDIQRLIILQSYVETYILPSITTTGDKYIIGNLNNAADVSSLEEADYDFAIVWEYNNTTSHKYKFVRDGVVLHEQVINSLTDSFFDYGIELQGSDAYLIACNVNSLNSEPSPLFGGSFTNSQVITTIDNTKPLTISIGNIGSDSDFGTTGMSEIVVPRPSNWMQATAAAHVLSFDGSANYANFTSGVHIPYFIS